MAVFDSNYDLANFALESLGESLWAELPFGHLDKFGSTKAYHLGTLTKASKLLIGDSGFSKEGSLPAVDFPYCDGRDFEVFSFMESPGLQLGAVPNESRHLTRVLVAVAAEYAPELVRDEFKPGEIDMTQEFTSGLMEIQMSHQQTQTGSIGDANFDAKNVALKHLGPGHTMTALQAWSWLIWDCENGYKPAQEVLAKMREMGFKDDPDLLIFPRSLRGMDTSEGGKLAALLGSDTSNTAGEGFGLPKTSKGLLGEKQERNFCTECGTALSEGARFCGSCGAKI
jgi:hypothetical protein